MKEKILELQEWIKKLDHTKSFFGFQYYEENLSQVIEKGTSAMLYYPRLSTIIYLKF